MTLTWSWVSGQIGVNKQCKPNQTSQIAVSDHVYTDYLSSYSIYGDAVREFKVNQVRTTSKYYAFNER